MKTMKKALAMMMTLMLALGGASALAESVPTQAPAAGDKVLVVYFSATGNTETAANYIAAATGADVLKLEPVQPYTDEDLNWTNESSRVSREYADESLRQVELTISTPENWDEYGTVYIGYPKIQYGFLSV